MAPGADAGAIVEIQVPAELIAVAAATLAEGFVKLSQGYPLVWPKEPEAPHNIVGLVVYPPVHVVAKDTLACLFAHLRELFDAVHVQFPDDDVEHSPREGRGTTRSQCLRVPLAARG